MTLVRRSDGRARYLVRETLQDVDEEIAELGDGSVILCTDDYTIYDDIDEYDGIDAYLAITHDDAYVIGDAHVNSCENRHSFIRQWLAKFRGVSKHHLQKYLDFLALKLNSSKDWFEKPPVLQCIGMSVARICVFPPTFQYSCRRLAGEHRWQAAASSRSTDLLLWLGRVRSDG